MFPAVWWARRLPAVGAVNYFGGIYSNTVTVDFVTLIVGFDNTACGDEATVSGGDGNTAS